MKAIFPLPPHLILSVALREVGPNRAKNLALIWQDQSMWEAKGSDGVAGIYSSTGEENNHKIK